MKRFTVVKHEGVFFVKDRQAKSFQETAMVSPIYFKGPDRPQQICNILNAEWSEFLANPE